MHQRLTRRTVAASTIAAALAAGGVRSISAQATPEASPIAGLPDTPAGQQLAWFVGVINGDLPMPDKVAIETHFDASFLAAVPPDQVLGLISQLQDVTAPITFERVLDEPSDLQLTALFLGRDGTYAGITITVDGEQEHRILGLFLSPISDATPVVPVLSGWDDLEAVLAAAGPNYGISANEIAEDGTLTQLHGVNADLSLPIGSAFKFYVLAPLAERIAAGTSTWEQELVITGAVKSFPSGVTQLEPDGGKIAIKELATRMISISDNTATDMLLEHVGRDACEAALTMLGNSAPEKSLPFLKTREMFTFKLSGDADRLARYANGDEPTRREILEAMAGEALPPLDSAANWTKPIAIDTIEWFASMADLGRAMVWLWNESDKPGLTELKEVLTKNPGVPNNAEVWKTVAYKGGSEPGVIALSWLLERVDGRRFHFACAVNNPASVLDEETIVYTAAAAMDLLAKVS
jgi:hypothetical protein